MTRYHDLWQELTGQERFEKGDRWRVDARIRRLNELGFDVDELAISTDLGGTQIQIQPKVVDAGHHSRRLLRLTGLDVEENQARRLLNDLDSFRASQDRQNEDEEIVAHDWFAKVYEPITRKVPRSTPPLEPAEVFHEVLEHRWYMSEKAGHDVPIEDAISDYVATAAGSRTRSPSSGSTRWRCRWWRCSATSSAAATSSARRRVCRGPGPRGTPPVVVVGRVSSAGPTAPGRRPSTPSSTGSRSRARPPAC